MATHMTDWENHYTQTDYSDALVTKLFIFQFCNTFAGFFYIAFVAGKIEIMGTKTTCLPHGDCTESLTLQLLGYQVRVRARVGFGVMVSVRVSLGDSMESLSLRLLGYQS